MNRETKILLSVISITVVVTVLLCFLLSGYDLTQIRIGKGFHLG